MVLKIAHRGASGYYRENTLLAIQKALELNTDIIEIDIQVCQTGELIVQHDLQIQNKKIGELSFQKLLEIDPEILDLQTVLDIIGVKCPIYLDLKSGYEFRELFSQSLQKFLDSQSNLEHLTLASFDHRLIKNLRIKYPKLSLGVICHGNFLIEYLNTLQTLNIQYLILDYQFLQEDFILTAHELGFKIWVYTINQSLEVKNLISRFKIDGILSDFIDKINTN